MQFFINLKIFACGSWKTITREIFSNFEDWTTQFGPEETDPQVTKSICASLKTALGISADLGHFVSLSPRTNHLGPFSTKHKHITSFSQETRIVLGQTNSE